MARIASAARRLICTAAGARLQTGLIKTPVRSPQANARCERVIGTQRRECLDWPPG